MLPFVILSSKRNGPDPSSFSPTVTHGENFHRECNGEPITYMYISYVILWEIGTGTHLLQIFQPVSPAPTAPRCPIRVFDPPFLRRFAHLVAPISSPRRFPRTDPVRNAVLMGMQHNATRYMVRRGTPGSLTEIHCDFVDLAPHLPVLAAWEPAVLGEVVFRTYVCPVNGDGYRYRVQLVLDSAGNVINTLHRHDLGSEEL